MKKLLRVTLGVLLSFVLAVSTPIVGIGGLVTTVEAATSTTPKTTVSKLTLYAGYRTYQIKFYNLKKGSTTTFKSSNAKIAKVSKTGIITPVKKGSATVTATIKQNNKTYTSKIKVTIDVPNIKFQEKISKLAVGDIFTFAAKANGTSEKIKWSVSDKTIASINSKTGKLTALNAGEVDVIATAGNLSSRLTVTIAAGKLSTEAKSYEIYDQVIILVTTKDLGDDEYLTFSIDNPEILSCQWGDWEGDNIRLLLDPLKKGTATVTITSSETADQTSFKVKVVDEPEGRDKDAKVLTAKEVYAKCAPSTVELQVSKATGEYVGSGFFIYSGVLITNYHVIKDATQIKVVNYQNRTYDVMEILAYDEAYDIAVLTIDAVTEHLVPYKENITVGENVYALGSPRGLTGSLSSGIVSSASRVLDNVDYVQVTAPISGGNSGGPLLNEYGEVIGINTFILLDSQNINFAVNVYQFGKLNFASPITAKSFYEANMTTKKVYEDETKSQKYSTTQLIENNSIVYGSLHDSNTIDGYKISLPQGGSVMSIFLTEYDKDMIDTYICIYDSYNTVAVSELYNDDGYYQIIDKNLAAGDYYIIITNELDYLSNPVNYSFLIYY